MTASGTSVPHLDVDPFAMDFFADPFPTHERLREAGMPGSIASCDMIRHSVTLTPKFFW